MITKCATRYIINERSLVIALELDTKILTRAGVARIILAT